MNQHEAVLRLNRALARWLTASSIVDGGWRTQADIRDRERRLMDLDDAITHAENFKHDPDVSAAIDQANRAMMGRPAA